MPFLNSIFGGAPSEEGGEAAGKGTEQKKGGAKQQKGKAPERKFLNLYCEDLTAKARRGGFDPIVGRNREIDRVIQILCRRTKKIFTFLF